MGRFINRPGEPNKHLDTVSPVDQLASAQFGPTALSHRSASKSVEFLFSLALCENVFVRRPETRLWIILESKLC